MAKAKVSGSELSVEKYELDGVLVDMDTATLAGAVGVEIDFPDDEPARMRKPNLPALENASDLDQIIISFDERIQIWLETCRLVKTYFGDEKFVRGNGNQAPFSLASMMRSPAEWMTDLLSGDDLVFRLLAFCTDVCIQFIRLMADTGVDLVSNGASPAGPEMISPEMYRTFALPYEKKIVDAAHLSELPYALHICGNTKPILAAMLETGTDALELDYKTDICRIHQLGKDRVAFFGNIDPAGVLRYGSANAVAMKVSELLKIYRDSPRLVVNAGCAIPPDTPAENIERLVLETRTFK